MSKKKNLKGKNGSIKVLSLDLSQVKGRLNLPEGKYLLELLEAEFNKNENSGNMQLEATFEVKEGRYKGQTPKAWIPCTESSLWRVRNFIEALGVEVPTGDIDLSDIVDEANLVYGLVKKSDYLGQIKFKLDDFLPYDGNGDSEAEEEEEAESEEEEVEPEVTVKEIMGYKEGQLQEVIDSLDLDVDLDDFDSLKEKRKAVAEAFESSSEDEGEDDEGGDEEICEDDLLDMNESELSEIIKEYKLKIKLKGNLRKMRNQVRDALKDKGIL